MWYGEWKPHLQSGRRSWCCLHRDSSSPPWTTSEDSEVPQKVPLPHVGYPNKIISNTK
jgi:hypothetical protein